jgi:REP element-mobilizing transposase RayT
MPRKLRLQYPGAIYHIMSEGNRGRVIARDDRDRETFLRALGDACAKTGWQVHAWCLAPQHFHLVVETPQPNLADGMKWFMGAYTLGFNRRHKVSGPLFRGRYKSLFVEGSADGNLRRVCDYTHLTPARAGLLKPRQPLSKYRWSSFGEYLRAPGERPGWLRVDRLLREHGISQDNAAGRREFERRMEWGRTSEKPSGGKLIERGWYVGSKAFREELLARMKKLARAERLGETARGLAEKTAERIVRAELRRLGWTNVTLRKRRKGDPAKVKLAKRLRKETTMTLTQIAQRLKMGTTTYLFHLLYWDGKEKPQARGRRAGKG